MDLRARIGLLVQAQGAKRAAAEVGGVARAVESVGTKSDLSARRMKAAEARAASFRKSLGGLARVMKIGALGLLGVGAAATKAGVGYDAMIEQQQTAFTTLLHSAGRAKRFTADLQKAAAATPFEFADLAKGAQQLLAFGYTAKQTKDQLNILGDAASSLGGGAEKLQALSLIFGQIKAKGRLQGDEVLQLAENGVGASQMLQKALGLTAKEFQTKLSAGAISANTAITALNESMSQKFAGGMAKQSHTLSGQLSTLKDNASQLLGRALRPVFTFLRDTAVPWLNKMIEGFHDGTGAGGTLRNALKSLGSVVVGVVGFIVGLVKDFRDGKPAAVALGIALAGLTAGFAAFKVTLAITGAINAVKFAMIDLNAAMLANPAGLIVVGIVALGAALYVAYKKVKWFHNAVNAVWSFISGHWRELVPILAAPLAPIIALATHFRTVKTVARSVFGAIRDAVQWVIDKVNAAVDAVGNLIDKIKDSPIGDAAGILSPGGQQGLFSDQGVLGIPGIPGLAAGGEVTRSGLTWIAEDGPELINLPRASRVTPLDQAQTAPGGLTVDGVVELHVHTHVGPREVGTEVRKIALRDLLAGSPA